MSSHRTAEKHLDICDSFWGMPDTSEGKRSLARLPNLDKSRDSKIMLSS